jgi:prefoldin subunit 5
MNVRVAKRVTAILRIGMVSFGILTLILLMMLYAFTTKMEDMIDALNTMNIQFTSMSQDMTKVRTTMHNMERNIAFVPVITRATTGIGSSVAEMRTEVDHMETTIQDLNRELDGLTGQVTNITWQIRSLDPAVQHIGIDVNRMSGPMRLFNDFNPFD